MPTSGMVTFRYGGAARLQGWTITPRCYKANLSDLLTTAKNFDHHLVTRGGGGVSSSCSVQYICVPPGEGLFVHLGGAFQ